MRLYIAPIPDTFVPKAEVANSLVISIKKYLPFEEEGRYKTRW
jgi:hypothetical protein